MLLSYEGAQALNDASEKICVGVKETGSCIYTQMAMCGAIVGSKICCQLLRKCVPEKECSCASSLLCMPVCAFSSCHSINSLHFAGQHTTQVFKFLRHKTGLHKQGGMAA